MHKASEQPETVLLDNLISLIDDLQRTLCEHSMPTILYKTTGFMVLQLLLLIGK